MKSNAVFLFVAFLLIGVPLLAQDVTVTATLLNPDIQVFMLSDFNFSGRGSSTTEIFQLLLQNTTPQQVEGHLRLRIYAQVQGELASGHTDNFVIGAFETKRLTNLDLFTEGMNYSLQEYTIETEGDELMDNLLTTGNLPSDVYYFDFIFQALGPQPEAHSTLYMDLSNPSTIDLIAPGSSADLGYLLDLYTTFPLFQWASNMTRWKLTVAEKVPGLHDGASPDQIIQDQVRFERVLTTGTAAPGEELIASTSFQYPASASWPLEQGKTYYWQLHGIVQTSGAPVELPSEIWAFHIIDPTTALGSPEQQQILALLRLLLGDLADTYLGSDGVLSDFAPTGVLLLNNVPGDIEDLQTLVEKVMTGQLVLQGATVE
jgi:hypothetical protein